MTLYLNWSRFFLPVGTVEVKDEKTDQMRYIDASDVYGLDYDKSYAFSEVRICQEMSSAC